MDADMSQVMNNNGPIHHDFVPHIARISKLMKTKVTLICHFQDFSWMANIPDGSLSASPANYCWWALADHEECELPGRAGPLVHHAVPVPDQTADKEHVNDKDQGWHV